MQRSPFVPCECNPPRLGFGTAGLMGAAWTDAGRLRLLNLVHDLGIHHFDTAPLYGRGDAETVLGKFARGRREAITITTKYGLFPPRTAAHLRWAVPLIRAIYHSSRPGKRFLDRSRAIIRGGQSKPLFRNSGGIIAHSDRPPYNLVDMERVLDNSLRSLKTDYIDCYLLHDCSEQCVDDNVVGALKRFVEKGKIRAFGLATGRAEATNLLARYAGEKWIVQILHTIFNRELSLLKATNNAGTITHGAINKMYTRVRTHCEDPTIARRWSVALSHDLSHPGAIAGLLLAHAVTENSKGIVLFGSREPRNIEQNVNFINNAIFSKEQVSEFARLVRAELAAGK